MGIRPPLRLAALGRLLNKPTAPFDPTRAILRNLVGWRRSAAVSGSKAGRLWGGKRPSEADLLWEEGERSVNLRDVVGRRHH